MQKGGYVVNRGIDAVLLIHGDRNVPFNTVGAVLSRTPFVVTRPAPSGRQSSWPTRLVRVRGEPRRWRHDAGRTPRE